MKIEFSARVFRQTLTAGLLVLPALISSGSARANDPRNVLGIIGALGAVGQRQAAMDAVRRAWNTVDPSMLQCLNQTMSPPPAALATSGVAPGDPRLQRYFQRCAGAIVQAEAARESAARRAAENEQGRQAAIEATRVEQARQQAERARQQAAQQAEQARQQAERESLAAEERNRQKAAEGARRAEQQRLQAEQVRVAAAQEAAYTDVLKMPELMPYTGTEQLDLVFLYATASHRLVRGLDGNFTVVGSQRPSICWAFPTTGASSSGFFLYAMAKLEQLANVKRFDLASCDSPEVARTSMDIILFSTSDLAPSSAEAFRKLGEAIKSGHINVLMVAKQEAYDAIVAADQRRLAEEASRAREVAATIGHGIDDGTLEGVGLLQFVPQEPKDACAETPLDPRAIAKAYSTDADPKIIAVLQKARRTSIEEAFIELKLGRCQLFVAAPVSLRKIRDGLKRDGVGVGAPVAWIEPEALTKANISLEEEDRADREAQSRARLEAEERLKKEQARKAEMVAQEAKRMAEQQARDAAAAIQEAKQVAEQQARDAAVAARDAKLAAERQARDQAAAKKCEADAACRAERLQAMMPSDELAVIAAVEAARKQFASGQNDMAKGASRPVRARAVCAALQSHSVGGWIGRVSKLDTNGDGKGVLVVTIGPDISVKTWNNALSDIGDQTLIDPSSSLFAVASQLHNGQFVRFGGNFSQDNTDCVRESSMSLAGSIREPEYIFQFRSISVVQ